MNRSALGANESPCDRPTITSLWQSLLDGVIDFIATDHALTLWRKAQYPTTPLECLGRNIALPLMLTQAMGTLHSCSGIRLDVKAVAKVWYSQKGAIALATMDWSS